jgi:hypothetical protein
VTFSAPFEVSSATLIGAFLVRHGNYHARDPRSNVHACLRRKLLIRSQLP